VIELSPDAEMVVVTYLRSALAARSEPYAAGVQVSTKLTPATSPSKHVRIRRVGGVPYSRVQDSPRIDVQVWYSTGAATDEQNRNQLALLVWALLKVIPNQVIAVPGYSVTCYRVADFAGVHAEPDPANDTRTVTGLTVEIGMRIRAVA
jgi:hypothetical protein